MKTWRQGVIGEIFISQSTAIYVHCLKYPLLRLYKEFENGDQALKKYMFSIMVEKSVLKYINRIGQMKLTKEENKEGRTFLYDSKEDKICIRTSLREENMLIDRTYRLEEIIDKYNFDDSIKGKDE